MQIGRLTLGLLALCMVSSCTTATQGSDESEAIEPRVCINTRKISGIDVLTNKHVYVREGKDEHFLLTMRIRCQDLRSAQTVAISDTTSRTCSRGFGKITYGSLFGQDAPDSCPIHTVESVGSKAHAVKIVEVRMNPAAKENEGTWTELPDPPE